MKKTGAGLRVLLAFLIACTPDASSAPVQLTGAGATFPNALYQKWFTEYNTRFPNVQVNYQAVGSSGGIRQVTEGTVDFGATDGPMTDSAIADFRTKRGSDVLHLPTALGGVVPVYNVSGVTATLKFTPEALAGIFLGKIKKWNDPVIAQANAGVPLPAADIVVVHRADGSGTTYVWTDYLSKVSAEWQATVGRGNSVDWPVGLGGRGNDGVSGMVRQTANSIGYVELIYAIQTNMSYGSVRNADGQFVTASLESVTAAAATAQMPADFRVSITNAPGAAAYPIASFTWLLVPTTIADAQKRQAITGFLRWMLTDGQQLTEALHFAKLPDQVVAMEQTAIAQIK